MRPAIKTNVAIAAFVVLLIGSAMNLYDRLRWDCEYVPGKFIEHFDFVPGKICKARW